MSAQSVHGRAPDLAGRLRELRVSGFPGVKITQRALGQALGGGKPISAPLISSWEKGLAAPTEQWIDAYASFFATSRSAEGGSLRLLRETELRPEELAARDRLRSELTKLRVEAMRSGEAEKPDPWRALGGSWHFADGMPVRIVTSQVPKDQLRSEATPTHPTLAYGKLYSYGNIDALFELHGHIRAANPQSDVRILKDEDIKPDDLSGHLVVLGGVDWNPLTRRLQDHWRLSVPIRQVSTGDDPAKACFDVETGQAAGQYYAELSDEGELLSDVGQFLRAPSPFNRRRTLTVCNALFGLGVYGVVRALTDKGFRQRNEGFLHDQFEGGDAYSILMRIDVVQANEVVTPDWTNPDSLLHEWPERS